MVPGLALSILTAGILTGGPTVVVEAGSVQGTLAVVDTFSPGAPDQGVSPVPGWTGADWPIGPGPVEPGLALSSRSTGVGGAEIFLLERPAAHEWISGVTLGAGADSLVVGGLTGGPLAAHVGVGVVAGVSALQSDTGLVGGAVTVSGALSVAPGVGVTQEVRRTAALSSVVDGLTVGTLTTGSPGAGILTPVGDPVTLLRGPALRVSLALVTTARQRVANIGVFTPADWTIVGSNLDKVNKVIQDIKIFLSVSPHSRCSGRKERRSQPG